MTFFAWVTFGRAFLPLLLATNARVESGRLSAYWPGDSLRTGSILACDHPKRRRFYMRGSKHVAHRLWARIGCGRKILVCAYATGRCGVFPVLDSGPWGIIRGPARSAVRDGRWRVWPRLPAPTGWRFRGVVDLSRKAWESLGSPRPLSRVTLYYVLRR